MSKKQSESKIGSSSALNLGTSENTKFSKWLEGNGIKLKDLAPKMENYKSLLDWNNDSMAYQAAKMEVLRNAMELYQTVGGKAADLQTEIMKISYFLDMMERKLLEEGSNPLDDSNYVRAITLKHKLVMELNKLKLDYVTRTTEKSIGDKNKGEEDLW